MPRATCILALALLAASPGRAATIHVPGDQPTIQAGIAVANPGDTVEVACGTYLEHDIVMTSGVTLRSATGLPDCVTIDAQLAGRVIICENVDVTTLIEGFTITRGQTPEPGGGVYCSAASPTISNCVFLDNEVFFQGGGLACFDSSVPTLVDCAFSGNVVFDDNGEGGAVFSYSSSLTFVRCEFTENHAWLKPFGGALSANEGSLSLTDCVFSSNSPAAVYCGGQDIDITGCKFTDNGGFPASLSCYQASSLTISNCTFSENWGGIYWGVASPTIENTIIAFNGSVGAVQCDTPCVATFICCDLFGNAGGDWVGDIADQNGINGNFSSDPLFCDQANGDCTLQTASPCTPANSGGCGLIGALPVGCGPISVETMSWTAIKSRYR